MKQSELQNTFKSSDTEEAIDIYFYRRLGYRVALFSAKHKIRPNTITIISIFWGVVAGHLYYYNNIWINILGILFLIIANTLDSADGQLARMTNDKPNWAEYSMVWQAIYGFSAFTFTLGSALPTTAMVHGSGSLVSLLVSRISFRQLLPIITETDIFTSLKAKPAANSIQVRI